MIVPVCEVRFSEATWKKRSWRKDFARDIRNSGGREGSESTFFFWWDQRVRLQQCGIQHPNPVFCLITVQCRSAPHSCNFGSYACINTPNTGSKQSFNKPWLREPSYQTHTCESPSSSVCWNRTHCVICVSTSRGTLHPAMQASLSLTSVDLAHGVKQALLHFLQQTIVGWSIRLWCLNEQYVFTFMSFDWTWPLTPGVYGITDKT